MKRKIATPENHRACAYVRVSTNEQVSTGVSLDMQTERLTAYCKLAGLDLVETFREEAVSGSVPLYKRPEGSKLVKAVRRGIGHIVTLKLDRMFRSTTDCLQQTEAWDQEGVTLHLIDFGGSSLDTSSATGRLFLTLMAALGEFERGLISERTCSALAHKKAGLQVFNHVPYGFLRCGDMLQPHADEQAIIAQIRQQRAQGQSLDAIAQRLNDAGVATKRQGGKWYAKTISNVLASVLDSQSLQSDEAAA